MRRHLVQDLGVPPKQRYPHLRRDHYASGSAMDWGRALPAVVQLLNDRRADVALPASPLVRAGEDHDVTFNRALAYWTALGHLLRVRLGWTHPALGLARWLDLGTGQDGDGNGEDCDALSLVRHVWRGDGALPAFVAWRLDRNDDHFPFDWISTIKGCPDLPEKEGDLKGPWGLHLEDPGGHVLSPELGPRPTLAWLHPFEPQVRSAGRSSKGLLGANEPVMLFRGSLESGWYGALDESPTDEVRVVNEQLGLIGRFHRSPTSGRWHSVQEEVHLWGARPG